MKTFLVSLISFICILSLYSQDPVAVPNANPTTVMEACSGGMNGMVTFSHSSSYHPDAGKTIIDYEWDFDDTDGLWWDTGNDPDFQTTNASATPVYTYLKSGMYSATLRVRDNTGIENSDNIIITVLESVQYDPTATAGGSYTIMAGDDLQLDGTALDDNESCGDSLIIEWDLDGNGVFENDSLTASSLVDWSIISTIDRNTDISIQIRATDKTGRIATNSSTLSISDYPAGVADANPTTVMEGCYGGTSSNVTFSHASSNHPDAGRTISYYYWDFDQSDGLWWDTGDDPDFQTTDINVSPKHIYEYSGNYIATLKVIDNTGIAGYDSISITVNASTDNAPIVDAGGTYEMVEGDSLQLNGNAYDDNEPCGDSLKILWDFDNDNVFENDTLQTNSKIPWTILSGLEKNIGLTIQLKAIDKTSREAVSSATLTIYDKNPIANFNYTQQICDNKIDVDASTSTHNNPARSITTYEWDINEDGITDETGQSITLTTNLSGNVPITLKVSDDEGNTDSFTETIVVSNRDSTTVENSICEGDTSMGETETGTYYFVETNQNGCDSIVKLKLTVHKNPIIELGNDTTITTEQEIRLMIDSIYTTYLWSNDSTSHEILITGTMGVGNYTYWVNITDTNNCSGSDSLELEIYKQVIDQIKSDSDNKFVVFPNPMINSVTIHTNNSYLYTLNIYDLTGKLLLTNKNVLGPEIELEKGSLKNGIYILELQGEETMRTKLMIK